ncbi:hypothetical protein Tcan_02093 [Toxocara canis]|uniref:Uncharacterized protein n=1 Tax=Toxocara canis TaxID=6265 RepID=A0A0B2URE4_TOXCA|nr:hypothetical protein Tcan_02093 [Toxocara canis]
MSAESSMTKKESNGSDQVPSGLEGSIETSEVEENAVCSHSNEVQPPNAQSKDGEAPNHELSELAKSMIDGLFGKDANVAKHSEVSDVATKFDQVRYLPFYGTSQDCDKFAEKEYGVQTKNIG